MRHVDDSAERERKSREAGGHGAWGWGEGHQAPRRAKSGLEPGRWNLA